MTKICPKCSAENSDTGGFCQNCGEDLKNVKSEAKPTETSSGGADGFWNNQSKGGKIAIGLGVCCIALILIIAISGMFAPDATTTTSTNSNTTDQSANTAQSTSTNSGASYIEVSYPEGSWDGSITIGSGNNENEINFDGSGTKRFDLTSYAGKDVYINAQKNDGGSGKLSAVIVRDGETKLNQSTTEGYGLVNGWVFSYD